MGLIRPPCETIVRSKGDLESDDRLELDRVQLDLLEGILTFWDNKLIKFCICIYSAVTPVLLLNHWLYILESGWVLCL